MYPIAAFLWSNIFAFMALFTTSPDIGGALETAFTTIVSDCLNAIAGILPIVLPILGAIAVINIGIRVFRKLAGR